MDANSKSAGTVGLTTTTTSSRCTVCQVPCTQSCGLCKKVSYCSKDHQKCDWKKHKPNCFPAIMESNEEFGRHFIATRDILQGELIFREKPIVAGPSGKEGLFPVCLSCYRIVHNDFSCSKCKWPLCNLFCQNNSIHSQNECPIFCNNKVLAFSAQDVHLYEKIIVLRALLLKEKDEKAWLRIIDLESHAELRRGSMKDCVLSNSAVKFVRETCNLDQFSDKEIDHVVGALGTNAFSSEDSPSCSSHFRSGSYLFYNASIPAHSCVPNGSWVIQMNSEYQLRASVNISAGEIITQLYTQSLAGTLERRKHLKESKYFSCHCSRCSDPTELNTFFSALTCQNETCSKMSFLLPNHSTQEQDADSVWVCRECRVTRSVKQVEKCLAEIADDVQLSSPLENDLESIRAVERLHAKYCSQILHQNHFLVYQIENDIMQKISFLLLLNTTNHKLSKQQCQELSNKLITLSRKCLKIANVICKGRTRHRGRLLYFLQQGLQLRIQNRLNPKSKGSQSRKGKGKSSSSAYSELKSEIDELIEVRREAGLIFENEPESREEYHLLKFLREYSKDMQNILRFYGSETNKQNS